MWYQGKISFQKENEKGLSVKITEVYLVSAVSYTDAEARIYEKCGVDTPDFKLVGLSRMKVNDVFFGDNEHDWWKIKVNFVSFDEKLQKEKLTPFTMMVNADGIMNAYNLICDSLGTVEDYHVTDICKTNILEVILPE